MAYENIVYEVKEGIATITFNRPKALNALNSALLAEFSQALDHIAADENIRVLILTGAGDKFFVAGADISEFGKPPKPGMVIPGCCSEKPTTKGRSHPRICRKPCFG